MISNRVYLYACTSKSGTSVTGRVIDSNEHINLDAITRAALQGSAELSCKAGQPWDPFNVELVVRAQNEPKPCPICGAPDGIHLCKI